MDVQINGYEDLVDIGGGGFSRVYRAKDLKHDRTVAIKVLDTRGANDSERRAFSRELKAMGGIGDHPHAVTVLESGFTEGDKPYLVMPFFEAGTFSDRLRDGGQQPVVDVVDLGIKIASILETVHQLGYLHRDVKPENIFVGEFGGHALGDFGISSFTDGTTSTRTVGVALTPAHAAPEVWEDEKPTAMTDVYSLGSTLYNLLAGRPPFTADSHAALLRKVLSEDPPRIGRDDIPYALTQLLNAMLSKDADDRPSSALEVANALHQIQITEGYPSTPITVRDASAQASQTATSPSPQPADPTNTTSTSSTTSKPEAADATVVRDSGILRPQSKTETPTETGKLTKPDVASEAASAPSTPAASKPEPAPAPAPAPQRSASSGDDRANDATEVRSPLQRPEPSKTSGANAPADAASTAAGAHIEEESGSRSPAILIGAAGIVLVGIVVAALTLGGSSDNVTDDPADAAVQDVDLDNVGPRLIANDPTDLRIERVGEILTARWEGATNPNVVYELMAPGAAEPAETTETELDLNLAGFVVEDGLTCVSVRVTTLEPSIVGEWIGPECTDSE